MGTLLPGRRREQVQHCEGKVRKYVKSDWGNNTWTYQELTDRLIESGTGSQPETIGSDRIDAFLDDAVLGFFPVAIYKYFGDTSAPGGFSQQPDKMVIKYIKCFCVASTNNKGQTVLNYSDHELWATEPPLRGRCIHRLTDLRQGRL